MTAESNLLAGTLQQTNIKRAQLDATIELYRSLGGGWK
jgi:outer membrane protein TolC